MIKLRRECGKGSFYCSKTRSPCELSITHNHELVTTSELLGFVVSVIFVNTFFLIISITMKMYVFVVVTNVFIHCDALLKYECLDDGINASKVHVGMF